MSTELRYQLWCFTFTRISILRQERYVHSTNLLIVAHHFLSVVDYVTISVFSIGGSKGYQGRAPPRLNFFIFTARKRSLGQGNIFAPVCHSVHRGVCLSVCWDTPREEIPNPPVTRHPPRRRPPRTRHPLPLGRRPPRTRHPLGGDPLGPGTPRHSACWEI